MDIGEINERIAELRIELIDAEDRHSDPAWLDRDAAIRHQIHNLEIERDLLP